MESLKSPYDTRLNKKLTTVCTEVFGVRAIKKHNRVEEALTALHNLRVEILVESDAAWLTHPLEAELRNKTTLKKTYFYLEPDLKLNRLLAERGTLLQQIEYFDLMGVTDAIERRPDFRTAVIFHQFCSNLNKIGISNPSMSLDSNSFFKAPIKRIHAVHHLGLEDPEIRSGLFIYFHKNTESDQVLYVCSPETLEVSLRHCAPDSVLIIDGHWEHAKKATHGVWETAYAAEIAEELAKLTQTYPGKINSIKLLGCHAGHLATVDGLPSNFNPQGLFFKDEIIPSFHEREMSEFRNRSVYYSVDGEFPFHLDSLAGQVIQKLNSSAINVTATSSRTYPYPAEAQARFNIGSDAMQWSNENYWDNVNTSDESSLPEWFLKLRRLRSITVVRNKDACRADYLQRWSDLEACGDATEA